VTRVAGSDLEYRQARKVGMVLETTPDRVVMIIEDDGKGFDPGAVNRATSPGLGLLGIRERLALIDGSLEIETGPGAGTTLIISAPCKESPAAE
jgi:signal transduction histidine kinase